MTWGLEYALLDRILAGKVSPVFLRTLQMLVGTICFGTAAAVSGKFIEEAGHVIADRGVLMLILLSTVTFSLANLLIALSIRDGSALLAGLVEMSYPIFIVAFAFLLFGVRDVSMASAGGGALIVTGVAILRHAA